MNRMKRMSSHCMASGMTKANATTIDSQKQPARNSQVVFRVSRVHTPARPPGSRGGSSAANQRQTAARRPVKATTTKN